jgi:hypothetical protein
VRPFPIVQAGAAQLFVLEFESQWLDQMQAEACVCRKAHDVAGVGRNFGFEENYVHHIEVYFG